MLRSMTGFGVAEVEGPGYRIGAELRSVNHRFLDIALRLPGPLVGLEDEVKTRLRDRIERGRVSVSFTFEARDALEEINLNEQLVNSYVRAASDVAGRFGGKTGLGDPAALGPLVAVILGQPDVLRRTVKNLDVDKLRGALLEVVDAVALQANEMKWREGRALGADLERRLSGIEASLKCVQELAPRVPKDVKTQIETRLRKLLDPVDLDPQRLAQEVAILADRCDITEECVRLDSHASQFRTTMQSSDQGARRLGFLLQEMHREVNTIGSKTVQLEMTHEVLRMKEEIEKLREQLQNLE